MSEDQSRKVKMKLSDLQLETVKNLFGHNNWEMIILDESDTIREKVGIHKPCSNGERWTGLQSSVPQRRKGPDLKTANY
jgi:hypothetical protein